MPSSSAIWVVGRAIRTPIAAPASFTLRRAQPVATSPNDIATSAARMSAKAISPYRSTASDESRVTPVMARARAIASPQLSVCARLRLTTCLPLRARLWPDTTTALSEPASGARSFKLVPFDELFPRYEVEEG